MFFYVRSEPAFWVGKQSVSKWRGKARQCLEDQIMEETMHMDLEEEEDDDDEDDDCLAMSDHSHNCDGLDRW